MQAGAAGDVLHADAIDAVVAELRLGGFADVADVAFKRPPVNISGNMQPMVAQEERAG
jgi:hypothetical protein